MLAVSFLLLYLAIVRQFEPLLLLPIAFGMMLTNIPGSGVFHPDFFMTEEVALNGVNYGEVLHHGGLLDIIVYDTTWVYIQILSRIVASIFVFSLAGMKK